MFTLMPLNINYSFNFGIALLLILIIQIISGIFLVFFYQNSSDMVFFSMNYIYNDIFFGNILRSSHCVGANLFFFFAFLHIFKTYFYSNFKNIYILFSGILMFLVLCGIGFLGYVLPWGQMSLWGATVITNLASVLPYSDIFLFYIWGDFAVSSVTMLRFFSLHFFLPFVLLGLVFFHFQILHFFGSSVSSFSLYFLDFIPMFPFFVFVDVFIVFFIIFFFILFSFFFPFFFFEHDNFIIANSLVTPTHIKPEWYFLFPYAVLRIFTSKVLGVIMLVVSIFSFFFLSILKLNIKYMINFNDFFISFFIFFFIILTFCGGSLVAFPFTEISIYITILFFFLIFLYYIYYFILNFFFF
uniref:Cytochrome b n=1 Tax=Tjalfiella sp. TaxID=3119615 RepID=A0AAU6MWZ1_9METZ